MGECGADNGGTHTDISSDISSSECESGTEDGERVGDDKQNMNCQEDVLVGSSGCSSLETGTEQPSGTKAIHLNSDSGISDTSPGQMNSDTEPQQEEKLTKNISQIEAL